MAKKCMSCGGSMNKMAKGGNTSDSPRLERLATKVNKKTAAGKPVSKSLTKRYDKAVDKVIVSGMKKMQKGGSNTQTISTSRNNITLSNPSSQAIKGQKEFYGKDYDPSRKLKMITTANRQTGVSSTKVNDSDRLEKEFAMQKSAQMKAAEIAKKTRELVNKKKTTKMAKGGMMKGTVGGAPKKPFAAGIPYYTGAGQTGPESMQLGGALKGVKALYRGSKILKKVQSLANNKITKGATGPMTKTAMRVKAVGKKK